MKTITNFVRGEVCVRAVGENPEEFVNAMSRRDLRFWRFRKVSNLEITLCVPRWELSRAEKAAAESGCELSVEGERGLPRLLRRLSRRYALLAGLILSVIAAVIGSRTVLQIEITGNERVPTEEILTELRRSGLEVGDYAPDVPARDVAYRVLMQDGRLCYVAVNLHGSRAEVIVRESVSPPEVADTRTPSDLIASCDGLVTRLDILSGTKTVSPGEPVRKGETLVSGQVRWTHPETGAVLYSGEVGSVGEVWARCWSETGAILPAKWEIKNYTGAKCTRHWLEIGDVTLKIYQNGGIPYDRYDKIRSVVQLSLSFGLSLPIRWGTETWREYTVSEECASPAEGVEQAKKRLRAGLDAALGEEDTVTSADYTVAETEDGCVTVTLSAECRRQIARTRLWSETEKMLYGRN